MQRKRREMKTVGGRGDRVEKREAESIQVFMFQAFLSCALTENTGFSTWCHIMFRPMCLSKCRPPKNDLTLVIKDSC